MKRAATRIRSHAYTARVIDQIEDDRQPQGWNDRAQLEVERDAADRYENDRAKEWSA